MLATECPHEWSKDGLGKDAEDADDGYEYRNHRRRKAHSELQVHEYAAILAGFGQVAQEHRNAQHQYRMIFPHLITQIRIISSSLYSFILLFVFFIVLEYVIFTNHKLIDTKPTNLYICMNTIA
jgi:hypothetical protein